MISKHTTGVTDEELNHRADNAFDCYFAFELLREVIRIGDYNRISVKTYYIPEEQAKGSFVISVCVLVVRFLFLGQKTPTTKSH